MSELIIDPLTGSCYRMIEGIKTLVGGHLYLYLEGIRKPNATSAKLFNDDDSSLWERRKYYADDGNMFFYGWVEIKPGAFNG